MTTAVLFIFWGSVFLVEPLGWWALVPIVASGVYLIHKSTYNHKTMETCTNGKV